MSGAICYIQFHWHIYGRRGNRCPFPQTFEPLTVQRLPFWYYFVTFIFGGPADWPLKFSKGDSGTNKYQFLLRGSACRNTQFLVKPFPKVPKTIDCFFSKICRRCKIGSLYRFERGQRKLPGKIFEKFLKNRHCSSRKN